MAGEFDYVLGKTGGQQEMIAKVYEEAYLKGKLANLTSIPKEVSVSLYGRLIHFNQLISIILNLVDTKSE